MQRLLKFINDMPFSERAGFFFRCGTTEGYVRKAISKGQQFGESLCINFERESARAVTCEDLRPDVDWAYLRSGAAALVMGRDE